MNTGTRQIRILMLEDDPADAELIVYEMEKAALNFEHVRVEKKEDFEEQLRAFEPDIILSDYHLPGFDGVSALAIAVLERPDLPFIFVSGAIGEEFAIDTLRGGATDYVLKDNLSRLVPSVVRALESVETQVGRDRAETDLRLSLEKIQRMLDQVVAALAGVTEIRDPYTAGHQQRVSLVAEAITNRMGCDASVGEGIRVAGKLHDIGKIYVPAEILSKPSRLSVAEFELVKSHPVFGYEILKGIDFPWPVAQAVYQHHERLDGSGYPNRLAGDEVILEARILTVSDVVEAMASHRPYRPALGIEVALEEVRGGGGTLYDQDVVDACLELFESEPLLLG